MVSALAFVSYPNRSTGLVNLAAFPRLCSHHKVTTPRKPLYKHNLACGSHLIQAPLLAVDRDTGSPSSPWMSLRSGVGSSRGSHRPSFLRRIRRGRATFAPAAAATAASSGARNRTVTRDTMTNETFRNRQLCDGGI